jgi:hypothetical protein
VPSFILPGAPEFNYLEPLSSGFIFCCVTLRDFFNVTENPTAQ